MIIQAIQLLAFIALAVLGVQLILQLRIMPGGMMASSYFATDAAANVSLLSKMMQKQVWRDLGHWANLLGFIKKTQNVEVGVPGNTGLPTPTGKAIEVLREFVAEGREDMIIPMKRILTGPPVGGDSQLEGKEERYRVAYKKVNINAVAKSVNVKSGPMSVQRFKQYGKDLFLKGSQDLGDWFSRYMASYMIQLAIFEGRSHNLTAGTGGYLGMKSLQRRSHPNFYVAGTGQIGHNGTSYTITPWTQAYEVAIAAALNGLAPGASTAMSCKLLGLMRSEAIRKRIPQTMVKEGIGFYPIVIHTSQGAQLRNDPEWKANARTSLPRGWDNPIFTGAIGYVDGCVVYEQDDLFGVQVDANGAVVVDGSANTAVCYGPSIAETTDNIFQTHNTNLKLAVLYGPSFLGVGIGQDIRMDEELRDYKRQLNAGADMIIGIERGDYEDSDGYDSTAGTFFENTSSLVVATHSTHVHSWT